MTAKTQTSSDFEAEDSDKEIYYPKAIRLQGVRVRVRGSHQHGFPIGAIVHSKDRRPNDGRQAAEDCAAEGKYAYFVIGRTGNVYQCFLCVIEANMLAQFGLGNKLSSKLVGIEVVSAGKLKKRSPGAFLHVREL